MFSANENILLRQHKRRIVAAVENTMPEEALDMGTSVMVMQVSCKDPGCVPLETAIIIVFPACGGDGVELLKGLPESNGGSYKTKILKPMADVTDDDVLDNLPPAFAGGRRTMERVCTYARDVMIAQITQLFGEGGSNESSNSNNNNNNNNTAEEADDSAQKDRIAMARFLQACLQDYIDGGCKPPPLGEPFANAGASSNVGIVVADSDPVASASASTTSTSTTNATDNNPLPETTNGTTTTTTTNTNTNTTGGTTTSVRIRQPPQHERAIRQTLRSRDQILSRLFEREHAPGIRKPGCPCCDPSDPAVLMDSFAML